MTVHRPLRIAPRPLLVGVAIRGALLMLCLGLTIAGGDRLQVTLLLLAVGLTGVVASVDWQHRGVALLMLLAEALMTGVAVLLGGGGASPALPYLLAPAFAGGLSGGLPGALLAPGTAAAVIVAGRVGGAATGSLHDFSVGTSEWVVIAATVGLLAAWMRRLEVPEGSDSQRPYAEAYRLLAQLRVVARQLASGLDTTTIAEALLSSLKAELPFDRGAVFVRSGGGRLVPLAYAGGDRFEWDVDLGADNAFSEAWTSQTARVVARQHSPGRRGGRSVVLPMRIGLRSFGLVALESASAEAFPREALARAEHLVADVALRLETGLLFDEVRELATAEERRRLAREIHDGIAQELASLGYHIDDLTHSAASGDAGLPDALRALRGELTRIISELRLSIFELRSDVDQHGGLGSALSEHVRSVGASSHLTVHLILDESAQRLPADTEAEILRIAQEAITNARKHARAENLWVTCRVDPPSAQLIVEDDGVGLREGRADSYGLEIMKERAARLRAELRVSPRQPSGTVVELSLGQMSSLRPATGDPVGVA